MSTSYQKICVPKRWPLIPEYWQLGQVFKFKSEYLGTFLYVITNSLKEWGSHTNILKSASFAKRAKEYGCQMKNNWHSAQLRFQLGHIIWIHIHASFEDVLNTPAVISKTSIKQRRVLYQGQMMLYQDYQPFEPKQNCKDTFSIVANYIKNRYIGPVLI